MARTASGTWAPLLVTANDYEMSLYNGDTGVIVETPQAYAPPSPARRGEALPAGRLDAIQTVHAMTASGAREPVRHRVICRAPSGLSTADPRAAYTAVTRARRQVHLIGSEEAVRRAVLRPANRASGLWNRLAASADLSAWMAAPTTTHADKSD